MSSNTTLNAQAYLEVKNNDNAPIKRIEIEHTNGKIFQELSLLKGEKVIFPVYLSGEGSFSIEIFLADKQKTKLVDFGYLEAGTYKIIIDKHKIISFP